MTKTKPAQNMKIPPMDHVSDISVNEHGELHLEEHEPVTFMDDPADFEPMSSEMTDEEFEAYAASHEEEEIQELSFE